MFSHDNTLSEGYFLKDIKKSNVSCEKPERNFSRANIYNFPSSNKMVAQLGNKVF